MALDLDLLRCFRRIVELGSVTRAASELGISQPALTRQIKRLEHDAGSELLVRNSRGVELTEAGQFLLARATPLIEQAELIAEELSAWRGALTGHVALCMPASLHHAVTYPLVAELRRTMPGVHLRVIDGFDALLRDQLRDGLVDLGLLMHDPDRAIEGVSQKQLVRDPLMLIGPGGAFPDAAAVKIRDMADLPLVLPGKRNSLRHYIDGLFARQKRLANIVVDVDSMQLAMDLVADGKCFSIVPASARLVPSAAISRWPIAGASISWAQCVQRKRQSSPIVRQVSMRLEFYVLKAAASGFATPV